MLQDIALFFKWDTTGFNLIIGVLSLAMILLIRGRAKINSFAFAVLPLTVLIFGTSYWFYAVPGFLSLLPFANSKISKRHIITALYIIPYFIIYFEPTRFFIIFTSSVTLCCVATSLVFLKRKEYNIAFLVFSTLFALTWQLYLIPISQILIITYQFYLLTSHGLGINFNELYIRAYSFILKKTPVSNIGFSYRIRARQTILTNPLARD